MPYITCHKAAWLAIARRCAAAASPHLPSARQVWVAGHFAPTLLSLGQHLVLAMHWVPHSTWLAPQPACMVEGRADIARQLLS